MTKRNVNNLIRNLPTSVPEEVVNVLVNAGGVRIERIVSTGHTSEKDFWYDQAEHEWVLLLSGAARLAYSDGTTVNLEAGDHVLIPAHTGHRVDWTHPGEATVWLAVFWRDAEV